MVYRGSRLCAPHHQAVLWCLPACVIMSACVLVHVHLQHIVGHHSVTADIASGLQREPCAKLLRSSGTQNGADNASAIPARPVLKPNVKENQESSVPCEHTGESASTWPLELHSSLATLDRLPQWFPPRPVDGEVKHFFRRLDPGGLALVVACDMDAQSR